MKLKPFFIDKIKIQPPLIMAPLHDITDHFFRYLLNKIGGIGLTTTEMIASEALIRNIQKAQTMMLKIDNTPYAIQLCGSVPEHLKDAAIIAESIGANIIDINIGCPANNITNSGSGSALLKNINLAEKCITAVIKSVSIPVTVKMRTGWEHSTDTYSDYLDFLNMLNNSGIKGLTIHPRTKTQQYKGKAEWSLIKKATNSNLSFPIIGNGDIHGPEDAYDIFRTTNCNGIMIGRAAITNPWIFQQIISPTLIITESQRIDFCIELLNLFVTFLPIQLALHKIKKISSWFSKGITNGIIFRQILNTNSNLETIICELENLKCNIL